MQLQYKLTSDKWVDLISITPVNKVINYYDDLNLVIRNDIHLILLFLNDNGNLDTREETEYNLRKKIRIKPIN